MSTIGILNVGKPAGCSSRDVVNRVDRLVRPAKAGHAGTLDPMASGVLVICVGQATRLIQFVQRMPKRYRATFLFGRHSETDDTEGEVALLPSSPIPTHDALETAIPQFLGTIWQRPPAHSAVKVAGQRAYKLARRGAEVELAARPVTIHGLSILRFDYPELVLDIECGSGTYVRALGRDLAETLGTGAVMSALCRTAVGGFRVDDAVPLEALTAETLPHHLQPPLAAVPDLPRVTLSDADLVEIRHGRPIAAQISHASGPRLKLPAEWAAIDSSGNLAAILREKHAGQLWPQCNITPQ
jgi:tRNA pseudouridine55 synthase